MWFVCAPKCSNYALTNLLFCLCKSMWVIELFINLNPKPFKAPTRPSTSEMLRTREHTPTPFPSIIHLSIRSWFHHGTWRCVIDGWIDSIIEVISWNLPCILFRHINGGSTMNLCDKCSKGWHIRCLSPLLKNVINRKCICSQCFHWKKKFKKIHIGSLVCVNNDV